MGMLTDVAIRKARSGERLAKLSDGGGLQLWLTPSGGKLWYLAYRFVMTWWADHLDTLRNGGRVLRFTGASA